MDINYFDALAGAGKTRALSRYADSLARRGQKVLFVQPTKLLIDKTVEHELKPLDPTYKVQALHGDVMLDQSVIAAIVEHFQAAERDHGEVLFITHAAFAKVPYIENRADWILLMDEVPQVDVFEEWRLPDTHDLLTPHFSMNPGGAVYGTLAMRKPLVCIGEAE
ncbi:MAG: DEAD/DEAH box helicase family protein [Methylobacterium sp.]|uniref:DEAD/DEAH box helicase family protein n=1 Tax=Methylobacterium sp. TaxID=409 RepID=UPI00258344F2|nr:DEAD/DEAH box helicase family protein [Methylobacterium sp.]MBY0297488.1 DEAD/DEAH box helicase family protein [Methylobacterium sp.]